MTTNVTHTYRGQSDITFNTDPRNGLSVHIETPNLYMRSVTLADIDQYAALYNDPDVTSKFGSGIPQPRRYIEDRIRRIWVTRWENNDPYSALAVFEKGTNHFMGHAVLGHGDHPGQAEIAGLGHKEYWQKGYGIEAATALVQEYAPATVKEGYLLNGKPLTTINATARPDNPASWKILEKTMRYVGDVQEHGSTRHKYTIELNEVQKPASVKVSQCCCLSFFSQISSMFDCLYQNVLSCGKWVFSGNWC